MTSRTLCWLAATVVACGLGACTTTYDFDKTTAGDGDGTDHELVSKTSSQFVRGVYADIVGRAPAQYDFAVSVNGQPSFSFPIDEETQLVGAIDALGDPGPLRALIVKGLVSSAEVHLPAKSAVTDPPSFIRDQFRRLLGREPNVYELAAFVAEWKSDPAVGPKAVVRALAGSRAYQAK